MSQDTLLKMCYNLDLTGLASAKKARLVAALDAALMNVKQGIVPEDKQPLNRAGSSAEQSSAGQVAAAEGSAGGSNGQIAMGSNGQAADATKGGPEGTSGGKVKAWEASTPDAAIEAADSLGYDGLIKLKRVSCLQNCVACYSASYYCMQSDVSGPSGVLEDSLDRSEPPPYHPTIQSYVSSLCCCASGGKAQLSNTSSQNTNCLTVWAIYILQQVQY